MVLKSIFVLTVFAAPLVIINTGFITSGLSLFVLMIVSGFGMSGIGLCIMHDANHGTYSKNTFVNKLMGLTLNLVGSNATIWKIQHNVLHHTYTNIEGADEDIDVPFFLRFSPNAKKYKIHRYQHIYFWFFYGLITLTWVTSKDFAAMVKYKKMGLLKNSLGVEILKVVLWKIFYFSYALVLPILVLPFAPWVIVLAFLSMHFVTGILISLVFQTAHVMPSTEFPQPDEEGNMSNNWSIHQLATTSNFAQNNKVITWLMGGLNHQVEHHLFPNVCHVHYNKLSKIVQETTKEFNIPYLSKKTFVSAIWDHIKLLKHFGRVEQVVAVKTPVKKTSNKRIIPAVQ